MRRCLLLLAVLLLAVLAAVLFQQPFEADEQLCCAALLSVDDDTERELAESITRQFSNAGYNVKVFYCDNLIETQLRQIQGIITMNAAVMIVHCNGNNTTYRDEFRTAQENGITVVAMDMIDEMSDCSIMVKDYPIFQGTRMCEQISGFLDDEYPDAEPGSVDVLLLERSSNLNYIYTGAGYKLIQEKYLRYFDVEAMEFIREPGGVVYYYDEDMRYEEVDEPTGGLILNEAGEAQLNPYYDERVCLRYATSRNVVGSLESQNVIDAYMATENGPKVRIVAAQDGEAAIGAAERLLFYCEAGVLQADISQIAVFGVGNTQTNRGLVMSSLRNESVFRGYVFGESADTKVSNILFMLRGGETGICYSVNSSRSILLRDGTFGIVSIAGNAWPDPDMFYERQAEF